MMVLISSPEGRRDLTERRGREQAAVRGTQPRAGRSVHPHRSPSRRVRGLLPMVALTWIRSPVNTSGHEPGHHLGCWLGEHPGHRDQRVLAETGHRALRVDQPSERLRAAQRVGAGVDTERVQYRGQRLLRRELDRSAPGQRVGVQQGQRWRPARRRAATGWPSPARPRRRTTTPAGGTARPAALSAARRRSGPRSPRPSQGGRRSSRATGTRTPDDRCRCAAADLRRPSRYRPPDARRTAVPSSHPRGSATARQGPDPASPRPRASCSTVGVSNRARMDSSTPSVVAHLVDHPHDQQRMPAQREEVVRHADLRAGRARRRRSGPAVPRPGWPVRGRRS